MDQSDYNALEKISSLAKREFGLVLPPEKSLMIHSRIKPRLKALGFTDVSDYEKFTSSAKGKTEIQNLISALTTNVSSFFRECHQFDILGENLDFDMGDQIKIWSAGCSNGQEPYTISLFLKRLTDHARYRILATDIDTEVLTFAKNAQYPKSMTEGLNELDLEKLMIPTSSESVLEVRREYREPVTFKQLNLLSQWPMKGTFDAIFCRNVVIYFDNETREKLWPRFLKFLKPEGLFFLGHSERISQPERFGLCSIGPNAYKRNH